MSELTEVQVIHRDDVNDILRNVCAYANQPVGSEPAVLAIPVMDPFGGFYAYGSKEAMKAAQVQARSLLEVLQYITPNYSPELRVGNVNQHTCVLLVVKPGENQPYSCPADYHHPEENLTTYTVSNWNQPDEVFEYDDEYRDDDDGETKEMIITWNKDMDEKEEEEDEVPIITNPFTGEKEPLPDLDAFQEMVEKEQDKNWEEEKKYEQEHPYDDEEAVDEEIIDFLHMDDEEEKVEDEEEEEEDILDFEELEEEAEEDEDKEVISFPSHEPSEVTSSPSHEPSLEKDEEEYSPRIDLDYLKEDEEDEDDDDLDEELLIHHPEIPSSETLLDTMNHRQEVNQEVEQTLQSSNDEIRQMISELTEQDMDEDIDLPEPDDEDIHYEHEDTEFEEELKHLHDENQAKVEKKEDMDLSIVPDPEDLVVQKPEEEEEEDLDFEEEEEEVEEVFVPEISIKDSSNHQYERLRNFTGTLEEQMDALRTYFINYVYEIRSVKKERIENYSELTFANMMSEATKHAESPIRVGIHPRTITVSFVSDEDLYSDDYHVSRYDGKTKFTLGANPSFLELSGDHQVTKRRSADETKRLILEALDNESYSTNRLAHKLGYKGISKTLTGIVNEMVQEGLIEYTNKNMRGSNQKLRKVVDKGSSNFDFGLDEDED